MEGNVVDQDDALNRWWCDFNWRTGTDRPRMIAVVLRQEVHLLSAIHPGEYGCHPGEADAADAASVVRDWELPIDFAEVGAAPMDFRKRSPGESQ